LLDFLPDHVLLRGQNDIRRDPRQKPLCIVCNTGLPLFGERLFAMGVNNHRVNLIIITINSEPKKERILWGWDITDMVGNY
jgi:hypothetical protein